MINISFTLKLKTNRHYINKYRKNLVFHSGRYTTSSYKFHAGTGFSFITCGKNTTETHYKIFQRGLLWDHKKATQNGEILQTKNLKSAFYCTHLHTQHSLNISENVKDTVNTGFKDSHSGSSRIF
jgi:hypothetical protein